MWHDMLSNGIPYTEKFLRTITVYLAIVILLRLAGKRDLAQINTLDLVVMLLLSNVVQNAVIGSDTSVSGGVCGAAVLIAANALLVRAASRYDWLSRLFESTTTVLAQDGRYDTRTIRRTGLRQSDLDVAIRRQGGDRVQDTRRVTLEPGGALLVELLPSEQSANKGDVRELVTALERLQRRLDTLERRQ